MSYLLDTNVVSELRKRDGVVDPRVSAWAASLPAHEMFLSVVSVFEVELGIQRIERRDAAQAAILREWLDRGVMAGFAGRILDIDIEVAARGASLHVPDPRPERDAYIAATAATHHLSVVTRNVADFASTGVDVIDPWAR